MTCQWHVIPAERPAMGSKHRFERGRRMRPLDLCAEPECAAHKAGLDCTPGMVPGV